MKSTHNFQSYMISKPYAIISTVDFSHASAFNVKKVLNIGDTVYTNINDGSYEVINIRWHEQMLGDPFYSIVVCKELYDRDSDLFHRICAREIFYILTT